MLKDLPVCFLIRKSKLQYVQFDVPSKIRSIDRRMPQIPNFQLRISKMCLYINLRNCPLECAGIFLSWAIVVVPQSCLLNSQARTGARWASSNFFKREKKDVRKKIRGSGKQKDLKKVSTPIFHLIFVFLPILFQTSLDPGEFLKNLFSFFSLIY